jgi:hypothetical protein
MMNTTHARYRDNVVTAVEELHHKLSHQIILNINVTLIVVRTYE